MSRMFLAFGEAGETGASPPLPARAVPVSTSAIETLRTKTDRRTGGGILKRRLAAPTVEGAPASPGRPSDAPTCGADRRGGAGFAGAALPRADLRRPPSRGGRARPGGP